jgi:hypothetical protein
MKFYVINDVASDEFEVNTVYYAKVSFSNGTEVLNSVVIPFQFTVPTFASLFEVEPAVFTDGVAYAYLNVADQLNGAANSGVAAYAFAGAHKAGSGKAAPLAGEEVVWELVTTEKHSYFYINGELEFVFLNFNARSLVIGAEKTQVSVYDIQVVIPEQTEAWAAVLARIPVAYYEASSDEEAKAIVYDKANIKTTGFEIAETTGVAATNQHIIADAEYITHNYSVSGKLNITSGGNNPHIQFSLDDSNFNNRFLLWDNNTKGTFTAAYAFNGGHKAGSGKATVVAGEEVAWELVTTEKHSYFYINGKLEFVFLNFNARSLVIGAEKTAVSFYDINTVTSANAEAWAAVLAREEIAEYENSEEWRARKAEKFLSKDIPVWYLPDFDSEPRIELSALISWMKTHESKTYTEWRNMQK